MIICAAVKFHMLNPELGDEEGNIIICGHRHFNSFEIIRDLGFNPSDYIELEQGFINHKNEFLNRKDAYDEALHCGQISSTTRWQKSHKEEDELFSEDLY